MPPLKTWLRGSTSVASVLFALSAAQAQAQETPGGFELPSDEGSGFLLETIIIQGELQTRSLQETATSVAVISGDAIEDKGEATLTAEIDRVPNVNIAGNRRGFIIRGVDQRGVGGVGFGLTITTQVDGVALPENQATFLGPYSTWDLEQVEVLRGPQSTQQGRNALAGAIIIRSKDPTFDEELKTQVQYGSRNTIGAAVAFNQPLIDETLAFRFSADTLRSDGWVENPTLGDDSFDESERNTYRGKLRWDPTGDISAVLSYSLTESFAGEETLESAFFPDQRLVFSDEETFEQATTQIAGLRIEWQINDVWSFESETNYVDSEYIALTDIDQTAAPLGALTLDGLSDAIEQDLRLRFELPGLRGVFGFFFTDLSVQQPGGGGGDVAFIAPLPPGLIDFTRNSNFTLDTRNFALYGEVDWEADRFLEGLSFTVGARYDVEEITTSSFEQVRIQPNLCVLGIPFLDAACALLPQDVDFQGSETYSAFLPKFGVTYDWTPDVSTSFTVQRSYRSGGLSVNSFNNQINVFDPEFTWNYELAFRGSFMDGALIANANAFYTDWTDQQVQVRGSSGNPLDVITVNAGESRIWGLEASVDYAVTPELAVFGAVGYANTKFDSFVFLDSDFSGNRFGRAPEWTGSLGAAYSFANGITIAGDMNYTGQSFIDASNDIRTSVGGYTVFNASITYEWDETYSATLFGRNITDKGYLVDQSTDGQARAGEPLTVGVVLSASF